MKTKSQQRPCAYVDTTERFYEAIIDALKFRAEACGYNLITHGSLRYDIDLVAVPWREGAISQESLMQQLLKVAEVIIGTAELRPGDKKATVKPNGRLAWSIYLVPIGCDNFGPYIDLSVMPPVSAPCVT